MKHILVYKQVAAQHKGDKKMDALKINFESLKKAHWSNTELENAKLITDFVQQLMNNHDFDLVMQKYNNSSYTQHNRGIPDGINGLVGFVQQYAKRFPAFTYEVKHIYADGDYIIFHSHATVREKDRGNDKKGFNIKDTWKIKDGEIVEHWDAIQPIDGLMRFFAWLTGGNIQNRNGVF